MSLPFVSIMTCTFGRPTLLEEAIECFLRQDYQGQKEMVVFNSFVPQQLTCTLPGVKIVNWHTRPPNLGACRNLCIEHCSGSHILMLDDDDLIRPHYMRQCVDALMRESLEWVKVGGLIWTVDRKILDVRKGPACNQFLFSKKVWEKVGRYPDHNAGEDRIFEERLVENGEGRKVPAPLCEAGYMYGWGGHEGRVFHISGAGEDEKNRPSGTVRMKQHAWSLLSSRKIHPGITMLRPHWNKDYEAEFVSWCRKTVGDK